MAVQPAQQPDSLIGSLQSEVADEASPMLRFLLDNARIIVLGILLFIAAIVGYWFWASQAEKAKTSELRDLGQLLVIPNDADRLSALEAFVRTGPESVRNTAWFAILETASRLGEQEKVYAAWQAIATFDPSITTTATLGMAGSLAERGQYKEALAALEGIAGSLPAVDVATVNMRIALLAELLGDYTRAMTACDAVIATPGALTDVRFWTQRRTDLEQKAQAAQPSPAE